MENRFIKVFYFSINLQNIPTDDYYIPNMFSFVCVTYMKPNNDHCVTPVNLLLDSGFVHSPIER